MQCLDVVVIGGGVLGAAVAARLSSTTASVCLLEAETDVCEGASKGNAGIAVPYYGLPGTGETELINRSCPGWEALGQRLNVPYRRIGAVMVALDDAEAERLESTRAELREAGVRGELLDPGQVRRLEPLVTGRCVAGLHLPDEGVIDSIALTVAYASLAATNGVAVRLGARVTGIRREDDGTSQVDFTGGSVRARFVVNAAGVAAGAISAMAGGEELRCREPAGRRQHLTGRGAADAGAAAGSRPGGGGTAGRGQRAAEPDAAADRGRAGTADRGRPAVRPGGLLVRACQRGRDKLRAGNAGARHVGRRRQETHRGGLRAVPGLVVRRGHLVHDGAAHRRRARPRAADRAGHGGVMTGLPFLVVGAGPSGLGFGTELARHGPVILLDRIPVTGGAAGRADADVRRFTATARRRGVELRLGESALRWSGEVLLVGGPGRFVRIAGRHLIVAGGLRPATAANLGLFGDRPAGVVAGTVAEHLLQAGVRLWDTAVVLGDGPWARVVAERARALGTRVVAIASGGDERLSVIGRDRVTHLRRHGAQGHVDVPCDAIVLAADPRPNRNISGALTEGARGVTFQQPRRPSGAVARYELAVRSARDWRERC